MTVLIYFLFIYYSLHKQQVACLANYCYNLKTTKTCVPLNTSLCEIVARVMMGSYKQQCGAGKVDVVNTDVSPLRIGNCLIKITMKKL